MKKIGLDIKDLFNIPGAEIFGPDNLDILSAVSADSRNVPQNSLFAAIKGNNFDGHDFIKDAVKNGASAVMINRDRQDLIDQTDVSVIVVDDTIKALGSAAAIWRDKLNSKIFAITGSAGKTTTKEMLSFVLAERFKVNKTTGNNNNHIGVPFTIFSTGNQHEILIAELGTNHFGEIKYTAEIVRPDYALITNIGHSHLEYLKDKKGVLKEKGILFDITAAFGGFIFVNNDDQLLRKYSEKFSKKLTYGFKGEPDVKGEIKGYNEEGNADIEIRYRNKKLRLTIPAPGEQSAVNFLAVCAAAFKLGLTKDEIISGIMKFRNVSKRMNIKRLKNFTIIDDTYNANPDSMKYSLSLLSRFVGKKKIALLGDMFELGEDAPKLHRELAKFVKKAKIDAVYSVGGLMENLYDALKGSKITTRHFADRRTLNDFLNENNFRDAVILIKGSRGMKMEEFAETLEVKEQ